MAREVDPAREGHARDIAGPRGGGDHGHRRQPNDHVHVRSSRAGLPGSAPSSSCVKYNIRYDTGFTLGLIAFTAAVLGGIGNLTGAVLGAVLIGMIQAFNEGLPGTPRP